MLEINQSFFDRIIEIIRYKGFKNISDFTKNGLGYASPEKINRLKDRKNKPSVDILLDISNRFEDIDPGWLLTGRGNLSGTPTQNANTAQRPPGFVIQLSDSDYRQLLERIQFLERKVATIQQSHEKTE